MKTKTFILAAFAAITTLLSSCTTSGNECNCPETDINQNPVSKKYDIVGTWEYKSIFLESNSAYIERYVFEKDNTYSYTEMDGDYQQYNITGSYTYNPESEYITLTNKRVSEIYAHFISEDVCVFGDTIYHRVK
ncbi:MAG: hypothetical protein IKD41_04380 [Alistipes sp.]|nr:hypothetical protein [Alistipes sp.]